MESITAYLLEQYFIRDFIEFSEESQLLVASQVQNRVGPLKILLNSCSQLSDDVFDDWLGPEDVGMFRIG